MNRQPDQLIYMLALRQIETASDSLRAAYGRLETTLLALAGQHPRTAILDWLESELALLTEAGGGEDSIGPRLLRDAVAFAGVLRG